MDKISFPLKEITITQVFGNDLVIDGEHVYAKWGYPGHNGIDFRAVGTPVFACDAGIIESMPFDKDGFGWYVRLVHDWGRSYYCHLSERIQYSGPVKRGQQIGTSGCSGFCTGPHLHFGIKVYDAPTPGYKDWTDPTPFLSEGKRMDKMDVVARLRTELIHAKIALEECERWAGEL